MQGREHRRILFIGTDRSVFSEGTEARNRLARYAVLGNEVHVIVFSLRKLCLKEFSLGPTMHIHPTNSVSRLFYLLDAFRIGRSLTGVTHVSAQDPFECGLAGYFVSRSHQAQLQLQMHIDAFSPYFRRESRQNVFRALLARHLLRRADCIRVVSERIKQSVLEQRLRLACEPVVLPVYVEVSRFETEQPTVSLHDRYPAYRPLVLLAGRLSPQKDIPTALRAFKCLVDHTPSAGLVIVGEGTEQGRLERLTAELGLTANVAFEPWQKDMLSYLKTADVFLMTSTHEGYQRAIGEAAAAGIPIVTTETGPVGSVYRHEESVLACPVGDVACIARELIRVTSDPALSARLTEEARRVAREAIAPSYETYVERFGETLRSCRRA